MPNKELRREVPNKTLAPKPLLETTSLPTNNNPPSKRKVNNKATKPLLTTRKPNNLLVNNNKEVKRLPNNQPTLVPNNKRDNRNPKEAQRMLEATRPTPYNNPPTLVPRLTIPKPNNLPVTNKLPPNNPPRVVPREANKLNPLRLPTTPTLTLRHNLLTHKTHKLPKNNNKPTTNNQPNQPANNKQEREESNKTKETNNKHQRARANNSKLDHKERATTRLPSSMR